MQYNTRDFLASLETEVMNLIKAVNDLNAIDPQTLNKQPDPGKWSVLQVVEHLNSYNRYYLTQIDSAITRSENKYMPSDIFHPGLLGGYFTKMMYSEVKKSGKVANKMNAPKDHLPPVSLNAEMVLNEFLAGEEKLSKLLTKSTQLNMEKIKVPISISKWIKLRLGDTFGFLIAHQVRHLLQIRNTLAAVGITTPSAQH